MVLSTVITLFSSPLEFIYWIKWVLAYAAIRIYSFFQKRRFDPYDVDGLGDPIKLGYIIPPVEKELESPFSESHLQDPSSASVVAKLISGLNFYAQTGVVTGTVSVNDGSDYEMYLYGEKIRSLGKSSSTVGCQFTSILGSSPSSGRSFQLTNASAPYSFQNLPFGFVVEKDGNLEPLKELDINIKPFSGKNSRSSFNANFTTGERYELSGRIEEPIVLYSGQGWSGYLELSFIEFELKNKKGYGLILSGEVYKEPKQPLKILPSPQVPESVPLTVQFTDETSHFGEISGGKGSSLGMLTQLSKKEKSFIVPKGIVVTTAAYQEFLTDDILDAVKHLEDVAYGNQNGDLKQVCSKVTQIVEKTSLPDKICHSIIEDLKGIFGEQVNKHKFAVRSSATGEDTAAMSAAGQMDTFLGVQGVNEIFTAVKKCWASQFGHIAVEYKRRNGQILNSPMAVVIQEMVACDVSGVMFTCDPVTNNPSVITITANYGLGETVVSGSVEPDTFVLRKEDSGNLELDEVIVGAKHQRIIMQDSGGTVIEDLDENSRNESCLSKETAVRLAKLSLKIEKFYKSTRDIEWGILNNEIYILQSRPVTNAAAETDNEIKHEFDAPLRCENEYFTIANVGEVMPGATSPLGMDVITKWFRYIFKRIAADKKYPDLILNSKYYNSGLLSYYNHMMGTVAELLTRYGYETPASKGFQMSIFGRNIDDPDMLKYAKEKMTLGSKPSLKIRLKYYWDLFTYDLGYKKAKEELDNYHLNFLKTKTAKEAFEAILKTVSDFNKFIMYQFDGTENSSNWNMYVFQILCNANGRFDNDVYSDFARLIGTSSNVESAGIPQAMQEVAIQISEDIGAEIFRSMTVEDAEKWLQTTSSLSGNWFRQFIKTHGHRCLKELDVHSITWDMNPKLLVKLLQNLAGSTREERKKEEESIDKIFSQLHVPLSFIDKCLLRFVLPNCRRAVRAREAGKSLTIKSYHQWRKGFRHLGKLMVSEGRLPDEELTFFLTIEEIEDLLETRSPSLISRANYRKRMFPILENYKFPEIMQGLPKPMNEEDESAETYEFVADLTMKGIPVSQGVTKGFARVAMTLEEASYLKPGEILITYCTDIGWSPYFPIISGVVTELGGLISHGAVVSREYGLPCVVGLQGATKRFQTGDYVLLDGKKGILQRLPHPDS
ncbi:putative phosphoenolpyruvate synthase [Araneus ventricosus]|uniref:Putative phosphoenolpyruvate synthase n=2 Tax=Araneus ventricosus TaxID=182803 RepID=A0A4Y2HQC0_ARAVE|nr:putative phosphoenolpyruvate synthase [Araneus ventricosus]